MEHGANGGYKGGMDGFIRPPQKPRPQHHTTPPPAQPPVPIEPPTSYAPYSQLPVKSDTRPKNKKKRSVKRKLAYSALTILIIGFSVGAWYGSAIIASLDKALHGNVFSDVHALFSTTKLKGEDQGRVNILLAGDSADDPNHAGANLTDSVMVVSIDTKDHTGFMLSIPRDLWVDIPGWSHQKINAANNVTNFSQAGYPKGGMGQLQEIVQTDLGIPIDYYALVNYTAFRDAVNSVGGITINIQSPDPRGIYDAYTSLRLPNGMVKLNGQQALALARARGDNSDGDISYGFPNSDFNRTQHQREMLVALSQKAKSIGVISNPIKVNNLFKSFSNNIHTDLTLQDILRFNQITKGMNVSKLQSLTYSYGGGKSLLTSYVSPDGQQALAPTEGVDEFGQLQQYYQQLTSNNPVVRESPSIVVLNGSGVTGLAHKDATTLTSDGYNVKGVADANGLYSNSMIIDLTNGHKSASLGLLKTFMPRDTALANANATSTEAQEASNYTADFVIIIGSDASSTQTP